MRAITKGAEPSSLTAHRQTPCCNYDNYTDKASLRQALVSEQRGLCCYCMCRIRNGSTTMKIEHWRCQRRYQSEQLNYQNMLGACMGGEGQPLRLQHCDTRKGDLNLKWNPADPGHHIVTSIRYEMDGSVRSNDTEFDAQLNDILNLNLAFLKNNRKGVLDGILSWWRHEKERLRGPVPRARFEAERNRRVAVMGDLEPFCQVAAWWIEQRLARMEA